MGPTEVIVEGSDSPRNKETDIQQLDADSDAMFWSLALSFALRLGCNLSKVQREAHTT
jgi:hypothetical protein